MTLTWPGGARYAAAFTFDFDAEEVWIAQSPANVDAPGVLSQGTYGARVGVPLILELLERHSIKGTFFVVGRNAERHPDTVAAILTAGHEIGVHGYTHTAPSKLTPTEEAAELDRALTLLSDAGAIVTGYRSPSWDVSPVTLNLIASRGLRYASQFMDDLRPYRHTGRQLVEIPVQWILDDAAHFWFSSQDWQRTIRSTREVEEIWLEELHGISALGGSFVLTMHPQVMGRPSRIALLDRMIRHVTHTGDAWVATCAEIAAHADGVLS